MQDDLELDPTDYAVIVKMRGPADRPWKWEITAPGNNKPLQRSSENFTTMLAALRAGKEALRVFPNMRRPNACSVRISHPYLKCGIGLLPWGAPVDCPCGGQGHSRRNMTIHYNLYRFGQDQFAVGHLINGDLPDNDEERWAILDAPRYHIKKLLNEHLRAQAALRSCRETGKPFFLFLRSFSASTLARDRTASLARSSRCIP